ncbi:pyridoxamine 5'-phosphate oxidase family protein [Niveibacterium sp. SC-1]|uniref:pyridoxamine 5'-phosphate oxidase family protein n=1 Tax=Niveibacterium sp. SC-1 TaxID=3135646 RepID=UPI0031202D34
MHTPLPGWPLETSPWHPGEQQAQTRAGVRERMESLGQRVMRGEMPDQHRDFFSLLPQVFVAGVDASGQPWASAFFGEPGFIRSPDSRTLEMDLHPAPEDPVGRHLCAGGELAVLGLQLETRRRNRANGRVTAFDGGQLRMRVRQSFGNCPKYIQTRARLAAPARGPGPSLEGTAPEDAVKAFVARADTFFIASSASAAAAHETGGVDVSHRGGPPGFVQWEGDTLAWPEFQGNNFFNTLGNLTAEARAGLLFMDWENGDMLHLVGHTVIDWEPASAAAAGPKALRRVSFTTTHWLLRRAANPWRWRFDAYAPELQTDRVLSL